MIPSAFGGNESYPIEVAGVIYVTTSQASVIAMSAVNGKVLWSYSPTLHIPQGIPEANRGVALRGPYVYVLTADDQLIALRKSSGKVVFDVTVANVNQGYFETMTPLVADNRVIVGLRWR